MLNIKKYLWLIVGIQISTLALVCFLVRHVSRIFTAPILVIILIGFTAFFYHHLLLPLQGLLKAIRMVSSGNWDYRMSPTKIREMNCIPDTFNDLMIKLQESLEVREKLQEELARAGQVNKDLKVNGYHFHSFFHTDSYAVFIHQPDGQCLDVNEKACVLFGYDKESLLQKSFLDLFPGNEKNECKKAFKTGEHSCSVRFESQMQKKNGALFWGEISTSMGDMESGTMQSIVVDITEKKNMVDRLRLSEEKFRSFIETANDAMFITDANGQITYLNRAMQDWLGCSMDMCLGGDFLSYFSQGDREKYPAIRDLLQPNTGDVLEIRLRTSGNEETVGELKTIGVFDDQGTFLGLRGIFRDITERKKIEEAQRLTQLGRLAADVAHELKNQLTVMYTLAELSLMDNTDMDEMRENVQNIYEQCGHINQVVKRLLLFSRPGKEQFHEVDIHYPIDLVYQLLVKKLRHDKIELIRNFGTDLPKVNMNEKQMNEVFMNLIQNAAEAMTEGGEIEVSTQYSNGMVRVDVRDNGCGIPKEHLKKIFDPFFTTKDYGTGLGVSACYGIIKAHGGYLTYSSEVGKGTTATVYLPANDPENSSISE